MSSSRLLPLLAAVLSVGLAAALIDTQSANAQTPEQHYLDWTSLPLPAQSYATRRASLMDALGSGIMLVPSHDGVSKGYSFRQTDDFWYLTGLELPSSMLILDADAGESYVFVPERDARFESASRPNDFPGRPLLEDPALWSAAGIEARDIAGMEDAIGEWVATERVLRVNTGGLRPVREPEPGYFNDWTASQSMVHRLKTVHPGARLENAYRAIASVRMIKDAYEIETIRRVVSMTVDAIAYAAGFVRDGVTERDLEAELEAVYKREGAQRLAFASIIKSGPNSLWPWRILATHYDRRNRAMQDGELVIFDVGTELDGYVSDVGRTFPVSGRFSGRQREIIEMEVAVADAIIGAVRPGALLSDLMEAAYAAIPDDHRPYMQTGGYFGHFIGMSTGDPALYDVPLAPGMVFTVEPWYYNHDEDISVFTEDVILVTEDGAEVLSAGLPRDPDALERMTGRGGR